MAQALPCIISDYRNASEFSLRTDTLHVQLIAAHHRMNANQLSLLGNSVSVDTAIERFVVMSTEYPNLAQVALNNLDLQQGIIFHGTNAGSDLRKYEDKLRMTHDFNIANEAVGFFQDAYQRNPSNEDVESVLNHDLSEDCHVANATVMAFCGSTVANDLNLVTVPEYEELQRIYGKGLSKPEMKLLYKTTATEKYRPFVCIYRGLDSMAALVGYKSDIERHAVFVTNDNNKVDTKSKRPALLAQNLLDNLECRRKANELLMAQCDSLQNNAKLNPEGIDCMPIKKMLKLEFQRVSKEFERTVVNYAKNYDADSTITVWRAQKSRRPAYNSSSLDACAL